MAYRSWAYLMLATVSATALSAAPSYGQSALAEDLQDGQSTAAEQDDVRSADIVVTAQRREQRVQDVPIAVSVLSSDTLSAAGIGSTDELVAVTPGLVTTRQLRGSTPFIRSIGTQSIGAGIESPVAQYVDGVYYMTPVGNLFSFNNIERVEVLKGPQGTLFGRNTTGGLIQIITRDPAAETSVQGSLSYGNYDTKEGALYATAGSDTIAADIALYGIKNDGYGRNVIIGGQVNYLNEIAGRTQILFKPGADTQIKLAADYSRNKSDIGATRNVVAGSRGLTARPLTGSIYDSQSGFLNRIDTKSSGVSLRIHHDLGRFGLQSTTAYRNLDSVTFFDQDAVPTNFAMITVNERAKTFQQELLLTGELGKLDLTTGLFYFYAKNDIAPLRVRSIVPASNFDSFTPQTLNSYAAFVDGTFAVTPSTNLSAGVRYTSDHRGFDAFTLAATGNTLAAGTVTARNNSEATFSKLTFRAVLDQKLGTDVLLYGSFNRGFKAGVYNPSAITQPVIQPETVDAFEIGLKTELLDRTLRFNLSAFHNTVTGIQLTRQTLGAQTIFNAAEGRSIGLEIETVFAPRLKAGHLQITANASFLDGEYTDFALGQVTVPNAAGGNAVVLQSLTGRTMIRSPKFTGSFGVDYTVPLGSVELGLGGNFYHSASFFWEPDNRLRQTAYDLLNAQISLAFGNDRQFRVRAFGKNLTDTNYFSYVSAGGLGDLAAPAAPRTYGVGIDFKF